MTGRTGADPNGASLRLCWIYPDRGTAWQRDLEQEHVWGRYQRIAKEVGFEMSVHKPEAIAVDATDAARPRFFLDGEQVTPEDTVFVTDMYSLPHQLQDVGAQVFTYTLLERAGFYLPIPPFAAYTGTEKAATMIHLADSPIRAVPTVRIASGREGMTGHYDAALAGLEYPLLVKPATWGMGLGVCVVRNPNELRGVIGLASGSDTALVVQPYFPLVHDYRVYVVDGEPHTVLRSVKQGPNLTASRSTGGKRDRSYIDPLPELADTVAYVVSKLPLPYLTVDFLYDGERFWLSEIEVDGAVAFEENEEMARRGTTVIEARFAAYRRGHDAWLAHRGGRR
jgi:glutathione synthase/RimK-type ligase-like ATP-grasp enzyme